MHSSHRCLGGTNIDESDLASVDASWSHVLRNQKERTCLFSNVCYDGRGAGWTYFAAEDEFSDARRHFGAGVDVWARGNFGRQGHVSEDLSFRLQRRPLPPKAVFLEAPLHVMVAPLAPSNFGHFLGNALYPAFAAVWRVFGAAATALEYQVIFRGPNQTDIEQMGRRCARWANQETSSRAPLNGAGAAGVQAGRPQTRCAEHVRLVSKFVAGLLPGISSAPPLWSGTLGAHAREHGRGALLCTRQLLAGTGELGFSTVHLLTNGTRRRVAPLLWGDFIEHMARRLAPRRAPRPLPPPRAHGATEGVDEGAGAGAGAAVLLRKEGRRAPTAEAYAALLPLLRAATGRAAVELDPAALSVRAQLALVGAAPLGITPDGGISFLCAFLPQGAALLILGLLERWLWTNDRRHRPFSCAPRLAARVPCAWHADHRSAAEGPRAASATEGCYDVAAVQPCVDRMLRRAVRHARLTWPDLTPPPQAMAANATRPGGDAQAANETSPGGDAQAALPAAAAKSAKPASGRKRPGRRRSSRHKQPSVPGSQATAVAAALAETRRSSRSKLKSAPAANLWDDIR